MWPALIFLVWINFRVKEFWSESGEKVVILECIRGCVGVKLFVLSGQKIVDLAN